jgi:hypothetical protein
MLGLIPGLGMVRRAITLGLCGASFWGGVQFAQWSQSGVCRNDGGRWNAAGYCEKVAP